MTTPKVIGIIGGIGSGKSTVAQMFGALGCIVADADANISLVLQQVEVQHTLREWWGDAVFTEEQVLDRSAIAGIVFADKDERKRLEALLHPLARSLQEEQFSKASSSTAGLVIDAPLLIESGLDALCDTIVFVHVPFETRLKRVTESRDWSKQDLQEREAAQLPLDKKEKKADYIVNNEGNLDAVHAQVSEILEEIRRQS